MQNNIFFNTFFDVLLDLYQKNPLTKKDKYDFANIIIEFLNYVNLQEINIKNDVANKQNLMFQAQYQQQQEINNNIKVLKEIRDMILNLFKIYTGKTPLQFKNAVMFNMVDYEKESQNVKIITKSVLEKLNTL